jgi:histidyl-tRNA synthetase
MRMAVALFRAVKGVQDVLPPDVFLWQHIEGIAQEIFRAYGFNEVRIPILEHTEVFTRSIGQATDIVDKEMYTFEDKGGRSLSMRPEGTASIVRAYVQNGMQTMPSPQRLYYIGPMFRYERPQKGRLRQFHQLGAEAFGVKEPKLDAEIIAMLMEILSRIGLTGLVCEINSLGCKKCRPAYREALVEFFRPKLGSLCTDCNTRHEKNPLRILDCKAPGCIKERKGAPSVLDHLCGECKDHFESLQMILNDLHVSFTINPEMVRGLDYYTSTAFEVTSTDLGAQNAVAAGGRYDNLVKEFGGPDTPAIGFAMGIERLVALLSDKGVKVDAPALDAFIATTGEDAARQSIVIANSLRQKGFRAEFAYGNPSLKNQMRKADKLGARIVLIIGEEELSEGVISFKRLADGSAGKVPAQEAYKLLLE